MNTKRYEYDTTIHENERGGAYVAFPWNIREEFGKGRVKVHATFDGVPTMGASSIWGSKTRKATLSTSSDL